MENKDTIKVTSIDTVESVKEFKSLLKNNTLFATPPEITPDLKIFSLKGKTAGDESFILGSKLQGSD